MKKRSGRYPRLAVDGQGSRVVSERRRGAADRAPRRPSGWTPRLGTAVAPWRRPLARHDPGKVLLDLAVSLAMGGDCLADVGAAARAPEVFGPVASDPTVSRLIDTLAADAPAALAAIAAARAAARGQRLGAGRRARPRPRRRRGRAAGHRRGRHPGHRPLREGVRGADVQARLRLPPAVGLRRPRPRGHRRAAGVPAATRERRLQHRRRPHRRAPRGAGPAARPRQAAGARTC